jgi:hypothetical protein
MIFRTMKWSLEPDRTSNRYSYVPSHNSYDPGEEIHSRDRSNEVPEMVEEEQEQEDRIHILIVCFDDQNDLIVSIKHWFSSRSQRKMISCSHQRKRPGRWDKTSSAKCCSDDGDPLDQVRKS